MARRFPNQTIYIIDPPGPFSPIEAWEKHRDGLLKHDPQNWQIKDSLKRANEHIAAIKSGKFEL